MGLGCQLKVFRNNNMSFSLSNFLIRNTSVFELNSKDKNLSGSLFPLMCPIQSEDTRCIVKNMCEITGSGPLTWSLPILGAKWQIIQFIILEQGFSTLKWPSQVVPAHYLSLCCFPPYWKNTITPATPPTSFFIQINISDRFQGVSVADNENTAWTWSSFPFS